MTTEYKTGIIYRIELKTNPDIRYIGSTLNELRYRWRDHKQDYQKYLKGEHKVVAIYPYFKQYGIKNFTITEIKNYQVVDKKHLETYEQLWVNKLKNVNKNMPFRINKLSKKQYYEVNKENIKEQMKHYRENNQDKIAEKSKIYRRNNIDKLKEYEKTYRAANQDKIKNYREANKDKMKEQKKQYYQTNKKEINERKNQKVKCDICDCHIVKNVLARHCKTNKHMNNIAKRAN